MSLLVLPVLNEYLMNKSEKKIKKMSSKCKAKIQAEKSNMDKKQNLSQVLDRKGKTLFC